MARVSRVLVTLLGLVRWKLVQACPWQWREYGLRLLMPSDLLHMKAVGASCDCWYLAMARVSRVLLTQLGLVRGKHALGTLLQPKFAKTVVLVLGIGLTNVLARFYNQVPGFSI